MFSQDSSNPEVPMDTDEKINDLAPSSSAPATDEGLRRARRTLSVGVGILTVLLVVYSFVPFLSRLVSPASLAGDLAGLLYYVGYGLVALLLAFFGARSYVRGLTLLSDQHEGGARRALQVVRVGFLLWLAGVAVQLAVAVVLAGVHWQWAWLPLLLENGLLVVGAVVSMVGFLSLSASKGMSDERRQGALHQGWTSMLLLLAAVLLSVSMGSASVLLKWLSLVLHLVGAFLFFRCWKRLVAPALTPEAPALPLDTAEPSAETETEA